jgi:hypothetical protein
MNSAILKKKFLIPIVEKVLLLFKVHPHLNPLPSRARKLTV